MSSILRSLPTSSKENSHIVKRKFDELLDTFTDRINTLQIVTSYCFRTEAWFWSTSMPSAVCIVVACRTDRIRFPWWNCFVLCPLLLRWLVAWRSFDWSSWTRSPRRSRRRWRLGKIGVYNFPIPWEWYLRPRALRQPHSVSPLPSSLVPVRPLCWTGFEQTTIDEYDRCLKYGVTKDKNIESNEWREQGVNNAQCILGWNNLLKNSPKESLEKLVGRISWKTRRRNF